MNMLYLLLWLPFSRSDYLKRLKDIYKLLTEKLEARKVAALMFQYDALSFKELESIQLCTTPSEAAEILLEIILKVREQQVYNCFKIALQETNQQHIWRLLSHDDGMCILFVYVLWT
jgi:Caspase recruitment domain